MRIITEIVNMDDPRVGCYKNLSVAPSVLAEGEVDYCIVESPKVIATALDCGYRPLSLLCERRHIGGDASEIVARLGDDVPVYTGSREVLSALTGYALTRGVLCAMERKEEAVGVGRLAEGARRIAVIDGVCDSTNTGSIFRAAAALGIDGVVVTRGSCDPLNRRAIRVSMGAVFRVPWCWSDNPVEFLKASGFVTLALALKPDSIPIDSPGLRDIERLAVVLGTEGDGLSDSVIASTDRSVVIPMHHGVDSLNVASAAALAFWELRKGTD